MSLSLMVERRSKTNSHSQYSGCHYIHYHRSPLRCFLLWLQVAHTACIFTSPSRHGHNKTSYQCICCRFYCIISASWIGSVRLTKTALRLLIFKSHSQVVHIYCYSDVSLRPLCRGNSWHEWKIVTRSGLQETRVCMINSCIGPTLI